MDYDDKIVEIAVIDLDGNVLINTLVDPNKAIPKEATEIHGIANKMVENAPLF